MSEAEVFITTASEDEVWPIVRDYHYSRRMPSNIRFCFVARAAGGLFGDFGEIQAAAIYGQPVNRSWPSNILELQRLVRNEVFRQPLTKLIAASLAWIKTNTECPYIISYADSGRGHHGGIYQAASWLYIRETGPYQDGAIVTETGEYIHGRQCNRMFGSRSLATIAATPGLTPAYHQTKYVYLKPMRMRTRAVLSSLGATALPYPKPDIAATEAA